MSDNQVPGADPDAGLAIWQPEKDKPAQAPKDLNRVRRSALIKGVVGGCIGLLFFFFWSRTIAYVAFGFSGAITLAGLLSPGTAYAAVDRVFELLGEGLGKVFSLLVFVPVFYLVFAPFGMLMRTGKRDRMEPKLDRSAASYWKERPPAEDTLEGYKRQF